MLFMKLNREIALACKRADLGLWDAHKRTKQKRSVQSGSSRLIFPKYSKKQGRVLRVSEQEARFAFVEALCQGPLSYSVETPTNKRYKFTGKKLLSAQTDLSLYNNKGKLVCNVEFKSKGVRPSAQKHFHIYKDLQKLLREPIHGLWFHLLESINNSTINALMAVFAKQIDEVQRTFPDDIDSPRLTIHICVLQHGFSLQKDILVPNHRSLSDHELMSTLQVNLSVSRSELLDVKELNGWKIHKYSEHQQTETI